MGCMPCEMQPRAASSGAPGTMGSGSWAQRCASGLCCLGAVLPCRGAPLAGSGEKGSVCLASSANRDIAAARLPAPCWQVQRWKGLLESPTYVPCLCRLYITGSTRALFRFHLHSSSTFLTAIYLTSLFFLYHCCLIYLRISLYFINSTSSLVRLI